MTVDLTGGEIRMLLAALNSRLYWEMAESDNRSSGEVIIHTAEMQPFVELEKKLVGLEALGQ